MFGMGQGGRGEDIHVRAATIPSPVPGVEKGLRESLELAGVHMCQELHKCSRAQVQEPKSPIEFDGWNRVYDRLARAVW